VKVNSKRPVGGEPCIRLFGDVGGMIVEDQADRGVRRIGGVDQLEKAMNSRLRWRSLTKAWTLPVTRSIPASKLTCRGACIQTRG